MSSNGGAVRLLEHEPVRLWTFGYRRRKAIHQPCEAFGFTSITTLTCRLADWSDLGPVQPGASATQAIPGIQLQPDLPAATSPGVLPTIPSGCQWSSCTGSSSFKQVENLKVGSSSTLLVFPSFTFHGWTNPLPLAIGSWMSRSS